MGNEESSCGGCTSSGQRKDELIFVNEQDLLEMRVKKRKESLNYSEDVYACR